VREDEPKSRNVQRREKEGKHRSGKKRAKIIIIIIIIIASK